MTPGMKEKFTGMTGIEPLNTYEYRDIGMPGFSEKEIMAGPYSYDSTQQAKARTAADTQTRMSGHMFKQKPTTPGRTYINPFEQPGARTAIPTTPLRTRIQDERAEDIRKRALGNIALQTDKSLMDVSDPSSQRQDIMSSFADTGTKEGLMGAGKNYAKKAAINFALQKAGLGFINPLMGLASLFGFKMPKGTGTKTAWQPDDSPGGDGGQGQGPGPAQDNVIQASIQEFSPEQADMMKQRHSQLQGVIDSGVYQGRQLTAEEIQMLQQKSLDIQKLMEQYLVDPEELGLARGGIVSIYG
jgi:hypothetical protein